MFEGQAGTVAVFMGCWALMFCLALAATAMTPMEVYWGRQGLPGRVPMSRRSRLIFVATVGLMIGAIVAGVTGFVYARAFVAAFMAAVVVCMATGAFDRRRWDHQKDDAASPRDKPPFE